MTTGEPSVTVVVAAFDAAATLEVAVRSALGEPEVVQCLVVDDASTDETGAVAAALAASDPRVEVVTRASRGGPSAARNDGLVRARGAWVCFLDADDAIIPGGLGALAAPLASRGGAIGAVGRFRAVDDAGADADVGTWAAVQLRPVLRRHGRFIEGPHGLTPEALVTRLVTPPLGAWLLETAMARAVGGFDERVPRSEDLELLVRVVSAGTVEIVERDVLSYRRHAAQRSAAHARRRWGRGQAMWAMLRAAPGARATLQLSRGMVAYHLELSASRAHASSLRVKAMGLRNLAVAGLLALAGPLAAVLPRRLPAPLGAIAVD
jgi:glycosyltransferase involved in cell wall biosynthesis